MDSLISPNQTISGILTDTDLKQYIESGEITIWPYEEGNLTPIGYDLTPSEFIFSINKNLLLEIHNEDGEKYCWIDPQDTVLILTREAVKVSRNIAGTFHSKVSVVSKGLGHISTTLDPLWQGPLLVSLNNPTRKRVKFTLEYVGDETEDYLAKGRSFLTLVLYRTVSPATKDHQKTSCRLDILKGIVEKYQPSLVERLISKITIRKNRKNHYEKLREMIHNIGKIDFVNGKGEKIDSEEFKENYERLERSIRFYTRQAHEATQKIITSSKNKRKKTYTIYGLLFIVCIAVIAAWVYGVAPLQTAVISFIALILGTPAFIVNSKNILKGDANK